MKELALIGSSIFLQIKRLLNQLAQITQQPRPVATNLLNLQAPILLLLNSVSFYNNCNI